MKNEEIRDLLNFVDPLNVTEEQVINDNCQEYTNDVKRYDKIDKSAKKD
jgi:hypothetical protein